MQGAGTYRSGSAQAIGWVLDRIADCPDVQRRRLSVALSEAIAPDQLARWRSGVDAVPLEAFCAACELAGLSVADGYQLASLAPESQSPDRDGPRPVLVVIAGALGLGVLLMALCLVVDGPPRILTHAAGRIVAPQPRATSTPEAAGVERLAPPPPAISPRIAPSPPVPAPGVTVQEPSKAPPAPPPAAPPTAPPAPPVEAGPGSSLPGAALPPLDHHRHVLAGLVDLPSRAP